MEKRKPVNVAEVVALAITGICLLAVAWQFIDATQLGGFDKFLAAIEEEAGRGGDTISNLAFAYIVLRISCYGLAAFVCSVCIEVELEGTIGKGALCVLSVLALLGANALSSLLMEVLRWLATSLPTDAGLVTGITGMLLVLIGIAIVYMAFSAAMQACKQVVFGYDGSISNEGE